MNAILRRIVLVLAVVVAILVAVMIALGVRSPSLDRRTLPDSLPADAQATIHVKILDAGSEPLELESDSDELVIQHEDSAKDTVTIIWESPPPSTHEHNLKLVRVNGDQRSVIDQVVWRVDVLPQGSDKPTEEESPDEPEDPQEEEVQPDETQPAEEVAQPEEEAVQPDETQPAEEVAQPEEEVIAEDPVEPAEEEEVVETEPTAPPIASVKKLEHEVKIDIAEGTTLYGQGNLQGGAVLAGYIRDKLERVRFTYECPDDPQTASGHLDALLAIGGTYGKLGDPFSVRLNVAGRAALDARGQTAIVLPPESWSIVLRTTRQVGGVVNDGSVAWQLARYEPDASGYAVIIDPADIRKE